MNIIACSNNWENCAMWVQDVISLSTNITAEITEKEANNFVRMCQVFAKYSECSTIASSDSNMTPLLEARNRFELEIVSTLEKYIREFNPLLKFYPFGSSQYGDKIKDTNFNLLITTSKA